MPLYDYENVKTGERREFFRHVELRDIPGWHRVMPDRILVHMHGLKEPDPINLVAEAKKGFAQAERTHGVAAIERETGRTIKQLKQIWNNFHETDQRQAREA